MFCGMTLDTRFVHPGKSIHSNYEGVSAVTPTPSVHLSDGGYEYVHEYEPVF